MQKIVKFQELEEFNTASVDMGSIGNRPLPEQYYDINEFKFTPAYTDFLMHILGKQHFIEFDSDFPVVIP
ncbi:MAG: hypothetical protein WC401_06865 [Bacteroidales bacterium]